MIELRIAHTADLDAQTMEAARALLVDAFDGDFDEHDWDHALGGVHALLWDDAVLVGHASVIQRRLFYEGRTLRAGYVEGVGVRADQRRRGGASTMMAALERVIHGAYDVGALVAGDEAADLYAARGWRLWRGPSSVFTSAGVERTPGEDGSIYVLPVAIPLDLRRELTCGWREGGVW